MKCSWCNEAVLADDAYPLDAYGEPGTLHHRECWVRLVVGSVGHQLGLCGCAGGPGSAGVMAAGSAIDMQVFRESCAST